MRWKWSSSALSLVEVIVSMAAAGMLVGGMASAVLLTTRALPGSPEEVLATQSAVELADQLIAELRCATAVHSATEHAIDFEIPDRDSDGAPERVRYAWAGAGQPILREYNGNAATAVLAVSDEFALEYALALSSYREPDVLVESGEVVLGSFDSTADLADYRVRSTAWPGQVFRPALPADAVEWTPKRVVLRMAQDGTSTGSLLVQLRAAGGAMKMPTAVHAQVSVAESSLPTSVQWVSFTLPACPAMPAGEYAAVSVQHVSGSESCKARYQYRNLLAVATTAMFQSTDAGANWALMTGCGLHYYVYGTVTTKKEGATQKFVHVTEARLKLRAPGLEQPVETSVSLLNAPEVVK